MEGLEIVYTTGDIIILAITGIVFVIGIGWLIYWFFTGELGFLDKIIQRNKKSLYLGRLK